MAEITRLMGHQQSSLMTLLNTPDPQHGFRALLEVALDAIVIMTDQGFIAEFNPAAEVLFGHTRDEAIGALLADLIVPEELRAAHQRGLEHYLATGEGPVLGKRIEIEALRKGGERFAVELAITRLPGEPPLFMAYLRDISSRLKSATALQSSKARLATLIANLNAAVLLKDEAHHVVLTNQSFCNLFQIPLAPEELVGQSYSQSSDHCKALFADPEGFVAGVARALESREPVLNEELTLTSGLVLERDYIPIFFEQSYQGHLWVYRDITERKQIQRTLQRDKELTAALSMASQQFLSDCDITGAFSTLLKSLLSLTECGYGFLGEVLRDSDGNPYVKTHALTNISWNEETHALWDQYAPNLEFKNLETLFGAVLTTGKPVIANDPAHDPRRGGLPSGHPPLNHFLGLPIFRGSELIGIVGMANRPGGFDQALIDYLQPFLAACANIISAYRDAAARTEAVRLLSEANHFISQINDTAPMLIYLYDLKQRRDLYSNRSIAALLGYSAEECAAFNGRELAGVMHPDDRLQLRNRFRLLRGYTTDERLDFECRVLEKSGGWRWFHSSYAIFQRDASGLPTQILGAAVDVTARKQAEESLLDITDELRRSNQALQEFASIASHDLKEPLRKIQAFGGRLKAKEAARLSTDGQDYLTRMVSATERMQALIDDLLAYSRVTSKGQSFVEVNLGTVVYEVLSDLEVRVVSSGAQVTLGALPHIEADAMQMRQLFQNLLCNALKFSRPGSSPEVSVTAKSSRPGYVSIQIADNGIGFAPEHAERIFEVFERLHGMGTYEGTGIGLAICRRIVERHGGTIEASSSSSAGAVFTVELPLQQKGALA